jgi:hypothetical protein
MTYIADGSTKGTAVIDKDMDEVSSIDPKVTAEPEMRFFSRS